MEISLDGFVIEGSTLIGKYSKFNLYRLYTVAEGKMAGKVIKKAEWYDTSFENCLKTIVQKRLEQGGEFLGIEDYLKRYEEIGNNLSAEIETVNQTLRELISKNEK